MLYFDRINNTDLPFMIDGARQPFRCGNVDKANYCIHLYEDALKGGTEMPHDQHYQRKQKRTGSSALVCLRLI
jgi:hypothetical protein